MELLSQQSIKNANMKLLYHTIFENSGISRTQLAKQTHLSKTTVSTLIDELIGRGFVVDSGTAGTTGVGRKPNSLQVKSSSHYVVVISWIESYVNVYLIDITGAITYEQCLKLGSGDTYISLSRQCVDESVLTRTDRSHILGICVVVSAMIDNVSDEIYSTTVSIPKDGGVNLITTLKAAFSDYKVALLGDTPCSSYAEKIYGRVTRENFAFINFDRGIGATLFIGGKMVGKADNATTQFGHYSIDPNGIACTCGGRGCLEATWGEPALAERVKEYGDSPALNRLPSVTYQALGNAALYGDKTASAVIAALARDLSYAIANLISTVHPKLIILGGKSTQLGDAFLREIRENLKQTGFRKMVDAVEIRYSKLDTNASLNGAMKYFFDFYFNFTEDSDAAFFIG